MGQQTDRPQTSTAALFEATELNVVNLGLELFHEEVKKQGVSCVHVDWKPPAGGNLRLINIIERLKDMDEEQDAGHDH